MAGKALLSRILALPLALIMIGLASQGGGGVILISNVDLCKTFFAFLNGDSDCSNDKSAIFNDIFFVC